MTYVGFPQCYSLHQYRLALSFCSRYFEIVNKLVATRDTNIYHNETNATKLCPLEITIFDVDERPIILSTR